MNLKVLIANPRGFCAGVERAINTVNEVIQKYPNEKIFVFHEIVHNKRVLEDFIKKGVIFTEDLSVVEENSIIVFSAHGVSNKIEQIAMARNLKIIDATCPLVKKVHNEAIKYENNGKKIIVIGNKDHVEIIGTIGRLKKPYYLISNIDDIENLNIPQDEEVEYITQTTLSVDYVQNIVSALKDKFPKIRGNALKDVCYATQNRQDAVKEVAKLTDLMLIIGSENSSNSKNLKRTAIEQKITSYLIDSYDQIDLDWLIDVKRLGISSGASAPDILIEEILTFLKGYFTIKVEYFNFKQENIEFKLPKI